MGNPRYATPCPYHTTPYSVIHRVDLFSLDIEGAEEAVLLTIPWHRVDIDILLIEVEYRPVLMFLSFSNFSCQTSNSDKTTLTTIMKDAGYKQLRTVGEDTIYRKVKKED